MNGNIRPARGLAWARAFAAVVAWTLSATGPWAAETSAAEASATDTAAATAASAAPAAAPPKPAASTAVTTPATVESPRSFGHVLGDVLTQRVLLPGPGTQAVPATLPTSDRIGLWLDRRPARIETDEQGRRWLVIDYQIVNAPRSLTAASLPALDLSLPSGQTRSVPAWPISIGPLTPTTVFGQGELQPLRPDRVVEPASTFAEERQLKMAAIALAIVLLGWLAWWAVRNAREAQRLPFARAWSVMRRLDESDPAAWRALHQAINATAGRVVQQATLPQLLTEASFLQPQHTALQAFYSASAERFFAVAPAASPFELRALGRALRDAERRHHA